MNILDKIVLHKRKEVETLKAKISTLDLEQSELFDRDCYSLSGYIRKPNRSGIIAEIKRQSPSKGMIHPNVNVKEVSQAYSKAGASAISVLTDKEFFGGTNADIQIVRGHNQIPILRKEFMIDEFQVLEAKAIGADAILLIAAVLSPREIKQLAALAQSLGLEVLMEVHDQAELDRSLNEHIDCVGVNNRDLKTFTVDIQTSLDLSPKIPSQFVKVAESGISDPKEVCKLKQAGFEGFLMGERFMKTMNPGVACEAFIQALESLSSTLVEDYVFTHKFPGILNTKETKAVQKLRMQTMKLKVCGMKYADNAQEVMELQPDFMGFIFHQPSKRFVRDVLPSHAVRELKGVEKVGVFVNRDFGEILESVIEYGLTHIQLHGKESPELCGKLLAEGLKVIKVFSIPANEDFNFDILKPYLKVVDFFLFDTKGKLPGGNGYAFDWKVLKKYPFDVPYFLSGGLSLENISSLNPNELPKLYALDVNSKFEDYPGFKNIDKLKELTNILI